MNIAGRCCYNSYFKWRRLCGGDTRHPVRAETVIRRTTTRYSGTVPWLPLIAAALLIPLLLTVLATCTSLGERDPIETDLTSRTEAALAVAGVDDAKVAFEGRDATVSGVPAGQEAAAKKAVEGVDGVRVAEVSGAGKPDFQQAFSERRAEIVKERLVELGISGDQITTKGFGATKPIRDRSTPEGLAANRRVEINVL